MDFIEALRATYSIEILGATDTPTSVGELSDSLDIPPATCYRRVNQLSSAGLLEECDPEHGDSHRSTLYRRTSDAVGIQFGRNPSVLTCDYVAHLSAVSAPAAGLSADGGSEGGTVLALVNDTGSHDDGRGVAGAAGGEKKD